MKETGVSCKVPSVGLGKNRGFLLKRPKVSDGFQERVLLSVVFVCLFVSFNVSDLLLSKASFKILHSIFPVWRNS